MISVDHIFDPAGNGFDIADMGQLVAVLVALTGILVGVLRWNSNRVAAARTAEREHMEHRLKEAIAEATKPIQPGYRNGGESLGDISMQNRILMERQVDVIKDVREIRKQVSDHMEWHVEQGDK